MILSAPTGSCVVTHVAWPDVFSVPVPSAVVPSRNVTIPVGTAVPEAGVTVAMRVIMVPVVALVAEAVSSVLVPIRGGPTGKSSLATKALVHAGIVVWNALLVIGKSLEQAPPVTYTLLVL